MEKREIRSEKLGNMNADAKCACPQPLKNRIPEKGLPSQTAWVKGFGRQDFGIGSGTYKRPTSIKTRDERRLDSADPMMMRFALTMQSLSLLWPNAHFTLPHVIRTCVTRSHLKLVEI